MHLVEGPHGLRAQPGTHREAKVCVMCLVDKETVTDVVGTHVHFKSSLLPHPQLKLKK